MIKIIIITVIGIYVLTYICAMIEIIGSWEITKKRQGVRWNANYEILLPAILPFAAHLDAITNFDIAQELYKKCKPNTHKYKESFTAYLLHGRLTIDEYYNKQQLQKMFSLNETGRRRRTRSHPGLTDDFPSILSPEEKS